MQTLYVILAAGLILVWLVLAVLGPRKVVAANALAVLRYGPHLRSLALLVALAPPLVMMYVFWSFMWRTPTTMNIAGISLLAFSIIAGLLLIEVTRLQVVLTEDGITRFSPWTKATTLRWVEVERVRYSSINRWFVVVGAGCTIRVSGHLGEIESFSATVRRKVMPERWASAAARLEV